MSAKVLLVANQKGGAGKTTLTSTLAVEAASILSRAFAPGGTVGRRIPQ